MCVGAPSRLSEKLNVYSCEPNLAERINLFTVLWWIKQLHWMHMKLPNELLYKCVVMCKCESHMIFTYNKPYCGVQVNIQLWMLSLEYSYDANYNPVLRAVKKTHVNRTVSDFLNLLDFHWLYLWNYNLHWNNLWVLSELTLQNWTHSCLSSWLKGFAEN